MLNFQKVTFLPQQQFPSFTLHIFLLDFLHISSPHLPSPPYPSSTFTCSASPPYLPFLHLELTRRFCYCGKELDDLKFYIFCCQSEPYSTVKKNIVYLIVVLQNVQFNWICRLRLVQYAMVFCCNNCRFSGLAT